jgi:hypothetical protein
MWLWLGVGTKVGAVGAPVFPKAKSVFERSTDEACMVHVPGTGLFGSGHCVVIAGFTVLFHASGTNPNNEMMLCICINVVRGADRGTKREDGLLVSYRGCPTNRPVFEPFWLLAGRDRMTDRSRQNDAFKI